MRKPAAALPGLEKIRHRLRSAGLRSTAARLWVMQHLAEAGKPVTHGEVAEELRPRGFDRATIYRNLIELTEAGLVSRIELGDHVWRFELRHSGGAGRRDHPHFVCVDCGGVECLPSVSVNIKPAPGSKQSRIRKVTEILLKGHCGQCS
ncbi:MAG TPA: Fur family transcriptional regulator [Pirellulales bacterium]|jgi:Fur family ferric uptake transcriptional regulator